MRCDGGSFPWDGDWVFDFGVAMTTDPDAPATLQQLSQMFGVMIAAFNSAAISCGRARDSLFDEIATAPAVAPKFEYDLRGPRYDFPSKMPPIETDQSPDPFAPMLSAARASWSVGLRNGADFDDLMRRALAAAIENAPITDNMRDAGLRCVTRGDGPRHTFGAMTSILAAELRGDGK